ncbi:MAG: nucleotidyl transferase AbiEii/AbiGii toxin family protein [Thermoanaerobaculia bacterium]
MNTLETILRRIQTELNDLGKSWSLVGGLAVVVRGEPRFTRDADLAVAVGNDSEAESLVRWLQGRGYRVLATVEQQATGRLATVRLLPPGEDEEGIVLDLLFASSGIESEVTATSEVLEILPGLMLPVARTSHLIALKVLSRDDVRRPTDLADLRSLVRRASESDLREARALLSLIEERGFHRNRDLPSLLQQFLLTLEASDAG